MDVKQVAKYALGSYAAYAVLRKLTTGDPDAKVRLPPVRKDSPKCIVIGAGFSGMCMSIKLAEKGIDHIVVEKEADVGGTWLLSNYPGVSLSVPHCLHANA
jgi:heterodisulfide reductase subunit A-like polyferredoxin